MAAGRAFFASGGGVCARRLTPVRRTNAARGELWSARFRPIQERAFDPSADCSSQGLFVVSTILCID